VPVWSQLNLQQSQLGIDCGRLVSLQLAEQGMEVNLSYPTVAFNGFRGFYYGDFIYHHGSASFISSKDLRLSSGVNLDMEKFFQNKIANGNFPLSFF